MNIANLIKSATKGRFFSVRFVKLDGSERAMVCRLGVKCYLKGGELSYNPDEHNHIITWDCNKKAYRTIPLDRLISFDCGQIHWKAQ